MAWTGTPVVKKVSDRMIRITGVSLARAEESVGTISLFGGGGDIELPENPTTEWRKYDDVELVDSISISVGFASPPSVDATTCPYITVDKSGTDHDSFLATFTNVSADAGEGQESGALEIYVEYH